MEGQYKRTETAMLGIEEINLVATAAVKTWVVGGKTLPSGRSMLMVVVDGGTMAHDGVVTMRWLARSCLLEFVEAADF
uniref:Uncharacterized protein n=1 Tax=Oryza sativa subsp. japonica TaxID=39947 RepID=Q69QF2_ORYSJ|nr:hypothetical protein [Oryza sativa Japonica Group]